MTRITTPCTHHNPQDCPHSEYMAPRPLAFVTFAIIATVGLQLYHWIYKS